MESTIETNHPAPGALYHAHTAHYLYSAHPTRGGADRACISARMAARHHGALDLTARHANDGISKAQLAKCALVQETIVLQRIRELAQSAAHSTPTLGERVALNAEVGQLTIEMNRIADSAHTAQQQPRTGHCTSTAFQVPAIDDFTSAARTMDLSTTESAHRTLRTVDACMAQINRQHAQFSTLERHFFGAIAHL